MVWRERESEGVIGEKKTGRGASKRKMRILVCCGLHRRHRCHGPQLIIFVAFVIIIAIPSFLFALSLPCVAYVGLFSCLSAERLFCGSGCSCGMGGKTGRGGCRIATAWFLRFLGLSCFGSLAWLSLAVCIRHHSNECCGFPRSGCYVTLMSCLVCMCSTRLVMMDVVRNRVSER